MDTHRGILDELHGSVNELGKRSAHVDKVLNDQWEHMHAQWDRIEVIRKELMLTVRYAGQGGLEASEKGVTSVEPAILDVGRVREARATSIRLNLGAGHVLVDGYLNVDSREMPGIDIVAEVGDLPFEHGEVAEISSAHLIEHFPTEELTRRILPYWFDLLEPGGTLRAITPDAGAMLAGFGDGTISFENLREVLYGGQEYDGDFHFSIFSVDTLTAMVEAAGFVDVEVVAEGRRNGMSLEFELVATKPGAGEG